MSKIRDYTGFFRAASSITDLFPRAGGKILDLTLLPVAGSRTLWTTKLESARRTVEGIGNFSRVLVVSDLNIGDAIFAQALASGLRDFLPDAQIDLAVNKASAKILGRNPEVTNLIPVFGGTPVPTSDDLIALARIASPGMYDFILSICPYFNLKDFPVGSKNVVTYSPFAAMLLNSMRKPEEVGHVVYLLYEFVHTLLRGFVPIRRRVDFKGVTLGISEKAVEEAEKYLRALGIGTHERFAIVNPSASTRFTQIPNNVLTNLLRKISILKCPIIVGSGFSDGRFERSLIDVLPARDRSNLIQIASRLPLDVYSALIDFSNAYLVGDGGPLHIAAARRHSSDTGESLRNKTAVLSVFGATPARTYAYDDSRTGFLPANQDAISRAFISTSPCRNITCINKNAKTCRRVRCFEFVDADEIADVIEEILERADAPEVARR